MTGNQAIEEAIRILLGGSREEMNVLNGSVSSGATSLTFTYPLGAIREGTQVCIGNEMFRVWSVTSSSQTAVVQPGMAGSTTSAHTSGDLVYVNPRFPHFAVLNAINEELNALSSPANGLYAMATTEFTYNGAATDYVLPATAIDVYDVLQDEPGPTQFWRRLPNWSWNSNANTTDFATGKSVHVPNGVPGRTVRVLYKVGFTALTDPTLDLTTTGLAVEMHDLIHLGVLMRLGPSREIKRNFTEAQSGDARRAEEVPGGAVTNSFAWVRNQRNARIIEERLRLERQYPIRRPA